jgi:hypothetical protein
MNTYTFRHLTHDAQTPVSPAGNYEVRSEVRGFRLITYHAYRELAQREAAYQQRAYERDAKVYEKGQPVVA